MFRYKMNIASFFLVFLIVFVYLTENINGLLRRCFVCRSRGELGTCKDPFTYNATTIVHGVETSPCASGWCGKIVESENDLKEEYGVATQRICLQRGPSDSEDRCAYTKWQFRRVLMCFCRGDLCNSSLNVKPGFFLIFIVSVLSFLD